MASRVHGAYVFKNKIVPASLKQNCFTSFFFLCGYQNLRALLFTYQISVDFHFALGLPGMSLASLQILNPSPPAVRAK